MFLRNLSAWRILALVALFVVGIGIAGCSDDGSGNEGAESGTRNPDKAVPGMPTDVEKKAAAEKAGE
jgi:hypothetical protein